MSRIVIFLGALLTFMSVADATDSFAQKKRAVLVGINDYSPAQTDAGTPLRKWKDLKGAVNDAETVAAILDSKYQFDEIVLLRNEEATREAIFGAISDLEEASSGGDVAVFYYAGHGSQVRNIGSRESDGLDETIVPFDVVSGALDIRDKELRDSFNKIIDKGGLLTMIFDSCHSGSITRGVAGGQTRFIEASSIVVDDPSNPPRPIDRGAVVISAAQDDELASELLDAEGNHRGAFSWALGQALYSADQHDSMQRIFLKTRALMKARGITQEPVMGGQQEMLAQSMFGSSAGVASSDEVIVMRVEDDDIFVQGGIATGLREGSELLSSNGDRYVIFQNIGMASSIANVMTSDTTSATTSAMQNETNSRLILSPGDILTIDKWIPSSTAPLRIHMPASSMDFQQIQQFALQVQALSPIQDPTFSSPNHILFLDTTWQLLMPDGEIRDLGLNPSVDFIRNHLQKPDNEDIALFVELPPFELLQNRLVKDLQLGRSGAIRVDSRSEADYFLTGRLEEGQLRYAWVLREATNRQTDWFSSAPGRTNWIAATEHAAAASTVLSQAVKKLNVVWGWLHLEGPPQDSAFPYVVTGFENASTGVLHNRNDSLILGEQYRMVLSASVSAIQDAQMHAVINNVQKRYVYVFALDGNGNGSLLYPQLHEGNVENDINFFTNLPARLVLPSEDYLFAVSPPLGVDTFFVLSSEEPIPDPGILNFSGVRTRGNPEGVHTPLSTLLFSLGGGARSERKPVPLNWSIEKISVRSVESIQ